MIKDLDTEIEILIIYETPEEVEKENDCYETKLMIKLKPLTDGSLVFFSPEDSKEFNYMGVYNIIIKNPDESSLKRARRELFDRTTISL